MTPKPWRLERHKYLTEAEVKKLMSALELRRDAELAGRGVREGKARRGRLGWWTRTHAAILLGARAGLRVNEIASLRVGHLDLLSEAPAIFVHGGKARICSCPECTADRKAQGVKLTEADKKKLAAPAPVYIDNTTAGELRGFLEHKLKWGEDTSPSAYLFPARQARRQAGHVSKLALQRAFKTALDAAGLPTSYGVHALRHHFGLYTQQKHGDLRFTQLQLRHASSTTTETYTDYTAEKRSELANGAFAENETTPTTARPAWIDATFKNPEAVEAAMQAMSEKAAAESIKRVLDAAGVSTIAELQEKLGGKKPPKPPKPKKERKSPKPKLPPKERRKVDDRREAAKPVKTDRREGERRRGKLIGAEKVEYDRVIRLKERARRSKRKAKETGELSTRAQFIADAIKWGATPADAEKMADARAREGLLRDD